jgi:hypothetical protein
MHIVLRNGFESALPGMSILSSQSKALNTALVGFNEELLVHLNFCVAQPAALYKSSPRWIYIYTNTMETNQTIEQSVHNKYKANRSMDNKLDIFHI